MTAKYKDADWIPTKNASATEGEGPEERVQEPSFWSN